MNTDKIYAEAIANEYSVKDTTKVVQLRKLDRKVKLAPTIFAYTWGIIATLILGVGMCFAREVLMTGWVAMTVGCVVGVIGIVVCASIIGLGLYMAVRGVRQLRRLANAVTRNDKK